MMIPRQPRYLIQALAVFTAVLLIFGVGDAADAKAGSAGVAQVEQDTTRAETPNEVQVTLSDLAVELEQRSIPAGRTTFTIRNAGEVAHSVEIEGRGLSEALETEVAPGAEATLDVELQPGIYTLYCPLEDHRDRGMAVQLTVTPRAEPTSGGPGR